MGINADERYRPLLRDLSELPDLLEKQEYQEAREKGLALKAACAAQGLRSMHVHWHLAIACDYAGDFEMAFESIREALALDPVAPPVWQSYRIIIERMQRTLADPDRPADDPVRPRIYGMLLAANEATHSCHLAMARYHRHTGKHAEALRILEALTTLHPAFADGWRELAATARAAGRTDLAERAETEAVALGGDSKEAFTPVLARAMA